MPNSLDDVLAAVDASDQENGEVEQQPVTETVVEETPESGQEAEQDQGHDAVGALHAERNRVRRKYTDTVADFERKLAETSSGFEKKLTDSLAENDRKWQQHLQQLAERLQPRAEPAKPAEVERPDIYDDPDKFVQHGVQQAVDPVQKRVNELREYYSQKDAVREHGQEKVSAAYNAMLQALTNGDPEANAAYQRAKDSMDPYGAIVSWHQRASVISEVGNDPAAYRQRIIDEALNDPAILAKAAEKLRGVKPAVVPPGGSPQVLPSLNRVTAAAGNDDEEEDAHEVFNSALRSGVRR